MLSERLTASKDVWGNEVDETHSISLKMALV